MQMLTLEAEKIIAKKESNGYREYRIPGLLCLQDALRHARKYGMGSAEAFRHMVNGGKRAD